MKHLLLGCAALLVCASGCSLLNPSSPQAGQATVVIGAIQSMAACIQRGVNAAPKTSVQAHADAITQSTTACVTQYEPEITAAAIGATTK